jgi:hypothetical protein
MGEVQIHGVRVKIIRSCRSLKRMRVQTNCSLNNVRNLACRQNRNIGIGAPIAHYYLANLKTLKALKKKCVAKAPHLTIVQGRGTEGSVKPFNVRNGMPQQLASLIYDPGKCSIYFHPLHGLLPIILYTALCFFPKFWVVGVGLMILTALDSLDCFAANEIWFLT